MRAMSQNKNSERITLRKGQKDLAKHLAGATNRQSLNVQWPGGYGKSIGIAVAYQEMRNRGVCTRLLIVVANTTQLEQIEADFLTDCESVGFSPQGGAPWHFTREANTIRVCEEGHEIFVTTIQSVHATSRSDVDDLLQLMMSTGRWMVACDEYHHYGDGMAWGDALKRVIARAEFVLATSATPDRDRQPTIFGRPDLIVSYVDAVAERAVQKMTVRRYHYNVSALDLDGTVMTFTTDELREAADKVGGIYKFEIKHGLRYSTQYLHPIIGQVVEGLIRKRELTGFRLQLLIRAMSCRHAQAVLDQVNVFANGELETDWMGTGPDGRSIEENRNARTRFCPSKDRTTGLRKDPDLDVLVQVAMAGEGFDCVLVCDIIDLGIPSLEGSGTQTKQFDSRCSRWVPGLPDEFQEAVVHVPSDHPIAGLKDGVMLWLDSATGLPDASMFPTEDATDTDDGLGPKCNLPLLTEDWFRVGIIKDAVLTEVTEDDPKLQGFINRLEGPSTWQRAQTDSRLMDDLKEAYLGTANAIANQQSAQALLKEKRSKVDKAVGRVARQVVLSVCERSGMAFDRAMIGAIKKRINGRLRGHFGERGSLLHEDLDRQIAFLIDLDHGAAQGELPSWLR